MSYPKTSAMGTRPSSGSKSHKSSKKFKGGQRRGTRASDSVVARALDKGRKTFFTVNDWMVDSLDVGFSCIGAFACIWGVSKKDDNEWFMGGYRSIMDMCGMSKSTAKRAVAALRAEGLLIATDWRDLDGRARIALRPNVEEVLRRVRAADEREGTRHARYGSDQVLEGPERPDEDGAACQTEPDDAMPEEPSSQVGEPGDGIMECHRYGTPSLQSDGMMALCTGVQNDPHTGVRMNPVNTVEKEDSGTDSSAAVAGAQARTNGSADVDDLEAPSPQGPDEQAESRSSVPAPVPHPIVVGDDGEAFDPAEDTPSTCDGCERLHATGTKACPATAGGPGVTPFACERARHLADTLHSPTALPPTLDARLSWCANEQRRRHEIMREPSWEEFSAYVAEAGLPIDARAAYDTLKASGFYDANGVPIRSWRRFIEGFPRVQELIDDGERRRREAYERAKARNKADWRNDTSQPANGSQTGSQGLTEPVPVFDEYHTPDGLRELTWEEIGRNLEAKRKATYEAEMARIEAEYGQASGGGQS